MADKDWRTVKLPSPLMEEIEEIKEKHGFSSNSDFITQATRELITKYKIPRFDNFHYMENKIQLTDTNKPHGSPYVEIIIQNNNIKCTSCDSKNCIHIEKSWNNTEISKQLKRKNIKKLV